MNAALALITLGALIGVALGRLSWRAVAVSSGVLAIIAAGFLHRQGFGAFSGITTAALCLTVHQAAYLVGVLFVDRWPIGDYSCHSRKRPVSGVLRSSVSRAEFIKEVLLGIDVDPPIEQTLFSDLAFGAIRKNFAVAVDCPDASMRNTFPVGPRQKAIPCPVATNVQLAQARL